jgi:hypothetical protein
MTSQPGKINAHQFSDVYAKAGIQLDTLGCVMLDLQTGRKLTAVFPELDYRDLFVSSNPERFWIAGEVASKKAHVTLLYGLMPGTTQEQVDAVMEGWVPPADVNFGELAAFPSPYQDEDAGYVCIVVKLNTDENPAILEAHQRLSFLPHIDTHAEYTPHMTLAYVKAEEADKWLFVLGKKLSAEGGLAIKPKTSGHPKGLDYGKSIKPALDLHNRVELMNRVLDLRSRYEAGDRTVTDWFKLENELTAAEFRLYIEAYNNRRVLQSRAKSSPILRVEGNSKTETWDPNEVRTVEPLAEPTNLWPNGRHSR